MLRNGQERIAWVVEDNAKSLSDVKKVIRRKRLRAREISTQRQFVEVLSTIGSDEPAPDIIILDLRLPWTDPEVLVENAIAGGLGCLELLRQEPLTRNVPVVIFSAFVHDELIYSGLAPLDVTTVDKMEPDRLRTVVDNLLPTAHLSLLDKLPSIGKEGEHRLLRTAAVAGAIITLVTLITLLISLVH